MDSELKQCLDTMEERLNGQMKALEERLIERIGEFATAVEARLLRGTEDRINSSAIALEERLIERIRDTETTLLTEFHKWAAPVDQRVRGLSSMLRAVDADLEYMQERLKRLENRQTGT